MPRSDELIREVESLPVDERLKVVDALLRSLNPPDPEIDRLWIAEARRRLDEIRWGEVQTVDGVEVMLKASERFRTT